MPFLTFPLRLNFLGTSRRFMRPQTLPWRLPTWTKVLSSQG